MYQTLNVCVFSFLSIGCGLDGLEWSKVLVTLAQVFKHTGISVTVYSLPEKAETTVMRENMRY